MNLETTAWPRVKLSELLQLQRRWLKPESTQIYREIGVRSFGKGIFHKPPIEGIALGNKRVLRIEPGDLVFNNVFAWEGAVAIARTTEAGMIGSHRFVTYRVDPSKATAEFLKLFFTTPQGLEVLLKASPGSAGRNKTLGLERFTSQSIPLPPLAEQQRVVTRIEELAAKIHEAHTLRHRAAKEAEALIVSRRRAVVGDEPKEDWHSLSDYVESIESGKSPATEGRPAAHGEWGVLKVGAVSFGVFDDRENKALPVSFHVSPSLEVRSGDLIMSRANTLGLVGACALVRKTRPKLMLSDKTFRFVLREPRLIAPEYLEQVLKSPALRIQIERGASGTSPTMKNISKEKVLALRLPHVPLSEQRRVVAELAALQTEVDALKRLQAETAVELDALLPAILDRAFKGQL